MKMIICLDDKNGMCFNHRRQSRDRMVTADIVALTQGAPLWMNAYSAPLFEDALPCRVAEDFLTTAPQDAWCFVEDQPLKPVQDRIDALVVYRWNRHYPADVHLDLNLETWTCVASKDFVGHSHEKITREEYHQ